MTDSIQSEERRRIRDAMARATTAIQARDGRSTVAHIAASTGHPVDTVRAYLQANRRVRCWPASPWERHRRARTRDVVGYSFPRRRVPPRRCPGSGRNTTLGTGGEAHEWMRPAGVPGVHRSETWTPPGEAGAAPAPPRAARGGLSPSPQFGPLWMKEL